MIFNLKNYFSRFSSSIFLSSRTFSCSFRLFAFFRSRFSASASRFRRMFTLIFSNLLSLSDAILDYTLKSARNDVFEKNQVHANFARFVRLGHIYQNKRPKWQKSRKIKKFADFDLAPLRTRSYYLSKS